MAGLGLAQLDPTVRAESLFLAPLAATVLLCATLVSGSHRGRGLQTLPWAAGLIVLAAWVVPAGATRGSAVALLLIAALLAAGTKIFDGERTLPFGSAFALALGAQALTTSEVFLAWPGSFTEILQFAFLPSLAAASMSLLARSHGAAAALTAGAFVAAAAGGWPLVAALALAAVAAGDLASGRFLSKSDHQGSRTLGWGDLMPAFALALGVGLLALRGSLDLRTAALLASAFLAALLVGRRPWLTTAALSLILFAGELRSSHELMSGQMPWTAGLGAALLIPLLLPLLLLAPARRWIPIMVLALLTARHQEGAPIAAGALAALMMFAPRSPRSGAVTRGAGFSVWLGAWLAGSFLAASYPWLRPDPLESFLSWIGVTGFGSSLLWTLVFLATILGLGVHRGSRRLNRDSSGSVSLGAGAVLLILFFSTSLARQPASESLLLGEPETLTSEHFRWTRALDEVEGGRLMLETNLAFAADLPADQPVAAVRLHHPDGSFTQRLIVAGRDTAEWAVQRPDVAEALHSSPPAAWSSRVAAQGGFFAQRYRQTWDLEDPSPVTRISVLRRRGLPPRVMLTLFRVELAP